MLEEGVSLARGCYDHKLNSRITPGRQLLGGEVLLKAKIALNLTSTASPLERCREVVYGNGEVINTPSEREPNNSGHVHLREGRPSRKGIYNCS